MATRKPPEPAEEGHAVIADWMEQAMPRLQPLVKHLDKAIRDAIPGLQYAVKWGKAFYGTKKQGWIIEMVAYHVSVNVVFLAGAELDPPPPDGEGKERYIKLRSIEEADTPEMRQWLKQAAKVPGWS